MKKQILFIESTFDNQLLMKRIVNHAGYGFYGADDHFDGWKVASSDYLDLILVTISPETAADVLTFVRNVKRHPSMTHIPVVAVMGHQHSELKEKAFLAGCDAYLPKPADIRQIQALLTELLAEEIPATAEAETTFVAAD